MRINPIACQLGMPKIQRPINFKSFEKRWSGEKINPETLNSWEVLSASKDKVLNRHTSFYFREDLDWLEFGKYILEKYKNEDKVNTYIWGCAEGKEAYTYSLLLNRIAKDEKDKFLPIKAMDISSKMIAKARESQNSKVLINSSDYFRIKLGLGLSYTEISDYADKYSDYDEYLQLKDTIKKPIEFSVSNVVEDIDKIDSSKPSIVLARNLWPYVNTKMYDSCAKRLYDNLKKGSIVVIGSFDLEGEPHVENSDTFNKSLIKAGFKPVDIAQGEYVKYVQTSLESIYIYEK